MKRSRPEWKEEEEGRNETDNSVAATTNNNNTTNTTTPGDALRNAIAGAMAGAFARTITAPIERIKLMLQLQGSLSSSSSSSSSSASSSSSLPKLETLSSNNNTTRNSNIINKNQQLNSWKVCRHIYTTEGGLTAFWRGNTPNVLRHAGGAALNFMLMDWYKSKSIILISPIIAMTSSKTTSSTATNKNRSLSSYEEERREQREQINRRGQIISAFLSGGLAGGTTTTLLYPIEFMRTRLALDTGSSNRLYPRGMRDVFNSIWKTDGIRGMYQGYGIALTGIIIYRALHLGGYDACKTELIHQRRRNMRRIRRRQQQQQQQITNDNNNNNNNNKKNSSSSSSSSSSDEEQELIITKISIAERFGIAQIVSITAGTICYPIDSVRRRLMMQAGRPVDERTFKHSKDAFRKIFKMEGIKGFYLGIGPNIVRSIAGALLLVSYDVFRGGLGDT
jgi:solute carrier family 25 (adenine nucleotide translocator) protein 4/5/6/31